MANMHKVVNATSAKTTALAAVVSCLYALEKNIYLYFSILFKGNSLRNSKYLLYCGLFNFLSVLQSANKCTGDFYLCSSINSSYEPSQEKSVEEKTQCVVCIITMFV